MVTRSKKVVSICQELMPKKCDCSRGSCVLRVWSKEVESWDVKVWGEEISKCDFTGEETITLY